MSDHPTGPKRLLEGGSDFERSLLSSARDEEPAKELEGRVLAALVAAPLATPPSPAAPSPPAADTSPFRLTSPRGLALMALGIGAIVAIMSSGPSRERPNAAPPPAPARPAMPSRTEAPLPPAEPTTAAPPPGLPAVTPDSLPTAPARATAPSNATPPAKAPPAGDNGTSIEREIELLDAVKAKLGQSDARGAEKALDVYDHEFPAGALAPERTVLRIRTLLLQGNRGAATKMGDDFLAKHPGSVHAKRIRALLAD